jgi:hypothetical protein
MSEMLFEVVGISIFGVVLPLTGVWQGGKRTTTTTTIAIKIAKEERRAWKFDRGGGRY